MGFKKFILIYFLFVSSLAFSNEKLIFCLKVESDSDLGFAFLKDRNLDSYLIERLQISYVEAKRFRLSLQNLLHTPKNKKLVLESDLHREIENGSSLVGVPFNWFNREADQFYASFKKEIDQQWVALSWDYLGDGPEDIRLFYSQDPLWIELSQRQRKRIRNFIVLYERLMNEGDNVLKSSLKQLEEERVLGLTRKKKRGSQSQNYVWLHSEQEVFFGINVINNKTFDGNLDSLSLTPMHRFINEANQLLKELNTL